MLPTLLSSVLTLIQVYSSYQEVPSRSFLYANAGSGIGVGYRHHGSVGFDISVGKNLIVWKEASASALFLSYPFYNDEAKGNFYWGMGVGLTYFSDAEVFPSYKNEPIGWKYVSHRSSLSIEGALGYETRFENETYLFYELGVGSQAIVGGPALFPRMKIGFGY